MKKLRTFFRAPVSLALGLFLLGAGSQSASATCQLNSPGGQIKRVVYIIFDNVHLRRDNPNVPSDMEQMPTLLNFLQGKGVINGNHHTPLISHTADDILTGLTGVYGDRHGSPISNSFGIFKPDNSSAVFQTSFVYWTTTTLQSHPEAGENLPVLVNEKGKNAPAPWPVFTRAGCDVGAFSLNGFVIENKTDITNIFGSSVTNPALQDYEGIAIHCAQGSPLCNNSHAKADALPDEPGGYTGFSALFGNINVQPVISPSGFVTDLDGKVIYDSKSSNLPGFPIDFNPTATASLGYAATMLEAGVPVVYTYIADAHDPHRQNIKDAALSPPPNSGNAYGPGEAGYVAQLKAWDQAFGAFFARLKKDGIDETNTLFVVVPDENDHFVGGRPSPANCDGVNTPCTYKQTGEIDAFLDRLLLTQSLNSTAFDLHFDDAPNMYIHGNPAPTDKTTRLMEHNLDSLTVTSVLTGNNDKLSKLLADPAEMKLLHMVTFSKQRTPTLTMFGNDNYFFETASKVTACATQSDCVFESPGFAWNHGDFQQQITQTWVAMVGPGVKQLGRHDDVFSDHTDIRPTLMALLGLTDDYVHEGRVIAEFMHESALPAGIRNARENFVELAQVFKQLNAPKGELGRASLVWSNRSVTSIDKVYNRYLKRIADITEDRDELAGQIQTALTNAAFHNQPVNERAEDGLGRRARQMIDQVKDLADHDED